MEGITVKKLLQAVLCLLLCAVLPACGPSAFAEDKGELTCGDYAYQLLEDGSARITAYTGDATELAVPAELDGHPVQEIGDFAFSSCYSLTSVSIPDSLTLIGENPFGNCLSLLEIMVSPDHPVLAQIDGVLYEKASKTLLAYPAGKEDDTFSVPEGIVAIGDSAFLGCDSLASVTFPEGLQSISDFAFWGCNSLTTVALPDGLQSIGDFAFSHCDSLASVAFPEGLQSIGDFAFSLCDSLTSVTLPEGLQTIDDVVFSSCDSLTAVTLPDSLTLIGANPFESCISLSEITVSPEHPVFSQIDGVLYEKDSKTLIAYPAGKETDTFSVPEGIVAIGDSAFRGCEFLTTVTLPESLTSIGLYAFHACPDSFTLIVPRDSYARQYAIENSLSYTYPDANDWLYN